MEEILSVVAHREEASREQDSREEVSLEEDLRVAARRTTVDRHTAALQETLLAIKTILGLAGLTFQSLQTTRSRICRCRARRINRDN